MASSVSGFFTSISRNSVLLEARKCLCSTSIFPPRALCFSRAFIRLATKSSSLRVVTPAKKICGLPPLRNSRHKTRGTIICRSSLAIPASSSSSRRISLSKISSNVFPLDHSTAPEAVQWYPPSNTANFRCFRNCARTLSGRYGT